MGNSQLVLPTTSVFMVSPRDYRLSGKRGYVVNFKAGVPERVPPNTYEEAIAIGAHVVESEGVDPAPVVVETPPEEDVKIDEEANASALSKALITILERNDPEDFKKDGTPKVQKVIAELSPEIPRPTATVIYAAYEVLQENFDLAED